MGTLNPLGLHGVNSSSPFAKLFVDIFYLTKPQHETHDFDCFESIDCNLMGSDNNKLEDISDPDDMEDGEIDDLTTSPIKVLADDKEIQEVLPTASISSNEIREARKKFRARKNKKFKNGFGFDHHHPQRNTKFAVLNTFSSTSSVLQSHSNGNFVTNLESQFNIDKNPERLEWLQCYLVFMQERGTPVTQSPTIPDSVDSAANMKIPLDLYKLFHLTNAQGGMKAGSESKNGKWKTIARNLGFPVAKTFILKKIYSQYLRPYEEHMSKKTLSNLNTSFDNLERERKFLLPTPVATLKKEFSSAFPSPVPVNHRKCSVEDLNVNNLNPEKKRSVFDRLGSKEEN